MDFKPPPSVPPAAASAPYRAALKNTVFTPQSAPPPLNLRRPTAEETYSAHPACSEANNAYAPTGSDDHNYQPSGMQQGRGGTLFGVGFSFSGGRAHLGPTGAAGDAYNRLTQRTSFNPKNCP